MALSVVNANPGTITSVGNAAPTGISSVGNALPGTVGQGGTLPDQGFSASTGMLDASTSTPSGGGLTYPNSNGTGGAVDPNAAAKAAALAEAASKRDTITGLIHHILGIYDSLYPQVDTAVADQGKTVNAKYDTEGKGLIDQFNSEFPQIGNAYAARGAYDSSYRQDSEGNAEKGLETAQGQLGEARNADVAKIGQFGASAKSSLNANSDFVNSILGQLDGNNDVNQLTTLQNAINQKLIEAQQQGANLNTQEGYVGQVRSVTPSDAQYQSLSTQLSTIVQGQAPSMMKKSIGIKQIQTSGLPDTQKNQLINDFVAQIDQQDQQKQQTGA